MTDSYF